MQEKRKNARFQKQYVIKYALMENRTAFYDVSQLVDISKGGLKFFSYQNFLLGTKIILFIRFPFMYPAETVVEGEIVGCQEVLKGKTFKMRVKFININPAAADVLEQMEKLNRPR